MKKLKRVNFLTKSTESAETVLLHSFFEPPAPHNDDEPWPRRTIPCALQGFLNTIQVKKIHKTSLFADTVFPKRYVVRKILDITTIDDQGALSELTEGEDEDNKDTGVKSETLDEGTVKDNLKEEIAKIKME